MPQIRNTYDNQFVNGRVGQIRTFRLVARPKFQGRDVSEEFTAPFVVASSIFCNFMKKNRFISLARLMRSDSLQSAANGDPIMLIGGRSGSRLLVRIVTSPPAPIAT